MKRQAPDWLSALAIALVLAAVFVLCATRAQAAECLRAPDAMHLRYRLVGGVKCWRLTAVRKHVALAEPTPLPRARPAQEVFARVEDGFNAVVAGAPFIVPAVPVVAVDRAPLGRLPEPAPTHHGASLAFALFGTSLMWLVLGWCWWDAYHPQRKIWTAPDEAEPIRLDEFRASRRFA